jgi:hypothetical protein
LHSPFLAGAIAIDTQDLSLGKAALQECFAALGAFSCGNQLMALAAGALLRNALLIIAVVANKSAARTVHREA